MCDSCIEWGGHRWHKKGSGYYMRTVRLHQAIWERANGSVPAGFHLHHKNEDKTDNRLENLELLSHADHNRMHIHRMHAHQEKAVVNSQAVLRRNEAERLKRALVCVVCGGTFHSKSKRPTRFCSSACVESARSGAFSSDARLCEYCGGSYTATRRVQRYCSKRCNTLAATERAATLTVRAVSCDNCGTEFESKRSNARFCQHSCALAFHTNNRFRGKVADHS